MSKLISLKDSFRSVVENGSKTVQDGLSRSLKVPLDVDTAIDVFKILLQYRHAKDRLESATENEHTKLHNEHDEIMQVISQQCNERNSIIENAHYLINEGIKSSNDQLITNGILIFKELLDKPLQRR